LICYSVVLSFRGIGLVAGSQRRVDYTIFSLTYISISAIVNPTIIVRIITLSIADAY